MLQRLSGLRVVSFESRRSAEVAELSRNYGGEPIQAPSMREVPLADQHEAFAFGEALLAGERRWDQAAGLSLDVVAYAAAPQEHTRGQRRGEERPAMDHIGIDVHKRGSQICILAEGGESPS